MTTIETPPIRHQVRGCAHLDLPRHAPARLEPKPQLSVAVCRVPTSCRTRAAGRGAIRTGARTGRVRAGELEVRPAFACARRSAMVLRRPREREVDADVAEGQVTVDQDADGLLSYVAQLDIDE